MTTTHSRFSREPRDEDSSSSPQHKRRVKHILARAADMVKRIDKALSSSTLHEDEQSAIHRFHLQARILSGYQLKGEIKLAFVGDSGVG